MGGKRSGPGFMAKTYFAGDMTATERDAFERQRTDRGCCGKCGRPMAVSTISDFDAVLLCSCGFRWSAKRGSRAYKAAAVKSECERAGR